jgi:hypothetical protein
MRILPLLMGLTYGGIASANPRANDSPPGQEVTEDRPANVPREFQHTPNGWFHPDCVLEIDEDETVDHAEHRIVGKGKTRPIVECQHPSYDKHGKEREHGQVAGTGTLIGRNKESALPTVDGWVSDIFAPIYGIMYLASTWSVPPKPANSNHQTLYLFNSVQSTESILQPVLGWNQLSDGSWSIAAWHCCQGGNTSHSRQVHVNPDDELLGIIDSDASHTTWWIGFYVNGVASTNMTVRTAESDFYQTSAGVLEVYGVSNCNQLPLGQSGYTLFRDIAAYDANGQVDFDWYGRTTQPLNPWCNYSAGAIGNGGWITY